MDGTAFTPLAEPRGFRETKKADKRRRIREAARALFSEQGYDATTVRQIARRADVALGTLSLYARDKRDLVLLIFNEAIPKILERALQATQKKSGLLEKLVAYFGVMNHDFHANLTLSRIHLQLNHYSGGMHSEEYHAQRQRVSDFLEAAISDAQEAGEIASVEDPAFIAKNFFFVYSAALRWWIASDEPDLEAGTDELRRLFALQIVGLGPCAVRAPSRKNHPRATKRTRTIARKNGSPNARQGALR